LDSEKSLKNAGIFLNAVDVYTVAPLIGVAYNKAVPVDYDSQDTINIHADAIIRRQHDLDVVYRLVLLNDKSLTLPSDERLDRAFRSDESPELQTENMEIFHKYMRGGVEWLYEQITEGATTQEDYLERIVELVKQYNDDFNLFSNQFDND
jgi:hypothetical protein